MPKVDWEKSGPPVQFWQKKMDRGGPLFSAKSGSSLPKVDLVQFCQEKSGPGPVSLSKFKQVHFWQGKKVDPVQFRCRNPGRSIFGRGKKWTRSSFAGRSTFGRGKKWTRSSFAAEIHAGPLLAGEKSGPGPVSLPKSRQVHFWQGKKVDPVQFCRQVHFWQGGKMDPVHFWQEKKVDPVQFCCRNPGRSTFGRGKKWTRSIFGKGKKWTRSSFAAEIQAGPILAGGKSGPGPVSLAGPLLAGGKSGPSVK